MLDLIIYFFKAKWSIKSLKKTKYYKQKTMQFDYKNKTSKEIIKDL